MLGPLPPLYRVAVTVCALAVFVAVGAWATTLTDRVQGSSMALVGAGVGAGVALLLLHNPSARRGRPDDPFRTRAPRPR